MNTITTKNGIQIFYKDWGTGQTDPRSSLSESGFTPRGQLPCEHIER